MQSNVLNQNGEPDNREHEFTDKLDDKLFPKIKRTEILTFTGRYIDPVNPDPTCIHIMDIAHALSNLCRYGGHSPSFYSVAEHSVLVHDLMEQAGYRGDSLLAGLMHDGEEAYLIDIPTPIKRQFPDYIVAGDNFRKVMFEHLGIDYNLYALVRPFDQKAYELEREELWGAGARIGLTPTKAHELFMQVYNDEA